MTNASILKIVVIALAGVLVLCVAGIIGLSFANPVRSIPDVLQNITIGVLGLLGGILVPSRGGEH